MFTVDLVDHEGDLAAQSGEQARSASALLGTSTIRQWPVKFSTIPEESLARMNALQLDRVTGERFSDLLIGGFLPCLTERDVIEVGIPPVLTLLVGLDAQPEAKVGTPVTDELYSVSPAEPERDAADWVDPAPRGPDPPLLDPNYIFDALDNRPLQSDASGVDLVAGPLPSESHRIGVESERV
ncbi:hypothetical protein [Microbacterium sp.]|uniref:hypothetical protein n=1 Tax=Microbacterium sp. TaxID=51671 RepID=UPI0026010AAE|nr:hypothetical protein [Microbacterium sp.]